MTVGSSTAPRPPPSPLLRAPLHRQPAPHPRPRPIAPRADSTTAAAVHSRVIVGEIARRLEILLDDEIADVALAAQVDDRPADILDDRRLDAFGRLVEDEKLGRVTRARPIASCCCWPPERSPPRRPSMSEDREQIEAPRRGRARRAGGSHSPSSRFSRTREQRKDLAALRHVAEAARARTCGGRRRDLLAVPLDRAARRSVLADDGAQQRGFADAVAAQNAGDAAELAPSATPNAAPARRRKTDRWLRRSAWDHRAEIDFDDARIGADLIERALGQHGPSCSTVTLTSSFAHEGHVVLDRPRPNDRARSRAAARRSRRSRRRSCRRPARRPAGAWGPARAASDLQRTASARATARLRVRSRMAESGLGEDRVDGVDRPRSCRAEQGREHAARGLRRREADCPRRCGSRTRTA